MPTYTYECKKCENRTEVFHTMSEKPRVTCSECGSRSMRRLLGTGAGLIFKGSGFYQTDYKNKGNGGQKSDSGEGGGSKSETKTESKSESKTESKSEGASKNGSSKSETKTSAPKKES